MADEEQLRILKEEGVEAWNKWVEYTPFPYIDLKGAGLIGANLNGADLRDANLESAKLSGAKLSGAKLWIADLTGADLTGADLTGADLTGADLRGANLRFANLKEAKLIARLNGADLIKAHLWKANLSFADLNGADLIKANLTGADLRGAKLSSADLSRANLTGADLRGANLNGADLSRANLSSADLRDANLRAVRALATYFDGATLTGTCIEDWNINSETNLENVICEYIYLKSKWNDKEQKYVLSERRPADPNRNFNLGEFAKLVEKYIETVDLIFREGIDWRAFLTSFQDLRVEYGEQNVSIQAIEKKTDGAFVIRLSVPSDVDKAEIESHAKQSYETKVKVLEAQYRAELQAKDREITLYKDRSADMKEIAKLLASRPITVEAKAMASSESQGDTINQSGTFGIGVSKGEVNAEKIAGTIYEAQPKSMAEVAAEIQQLLNQLSQTYPISTTAEQMVVATEAIKRIESNPTLKQRIINAAKEGGLAALEKALDNPAGAFITSAIKGWLEAEAQ